MSADEDGSEARVSLMYLLLYVVERIGRVDGKADEDNVRVGV